MFAFSVISIIILGIEVTTAFQDRTKNESVDIQVKRDSADEK